MVSFLLVPRLKLWSEQSQGLTTGDLFSDRFDLKTGRLAALVIALSWFSFVGGQIIAGGKLLQVTMTMDLSLAIAVSGLVILGYTVMGGLKAVIYTDVFRWWFFLSGLCCCWCRLAD